MVNDFCGGYKIRRIEENLREDVKQDWGVYKNFYSNEYSIKFLLELLVAGFGRMKRLAF
jgi:hypothetical protein